MSDPTNEVRLTPAAGENEPTTAADEAMIESELLVEDVSIDGMCGVY